MLVAIVHFNASPRHGMKLERSQKTHGRGNVLLLVEDGVSSSRWSGTRGERRRRGIGGEWGREIAGRTNRNAGTMLLCILI